MIGVNEGEPGNQQRLAVLNCLKDGLPDFFVCPSAVVLPVPERKPYRGCTEQRAGSPIFLAAHP
jgi:hypothetical protein